jgi:hypothetical protein
LKQSGYPKKSFGLLRLTESLAHRELCLGPFCYKEIFMKKYVFIEMSNIAAYSKAVMIQVSEDQPVINPPGIAGGWYGFAIDTVVQVGWKATYGANGWEFSEPTYQDHVDQVTLFVRQRLGVAAGWLDINPVNYKVNLGVATPEEEAAWLAYQQYYIAVSDVKKQAGYPYTIDWPVAPF